MRMKIYRDYMVKNAFYLTLLALSICTVVFIVGNVFRLSHLLINKGVAPGLIFGLLKCIVPFVIGYSLPVASLTGVVLLFGRMSADNEINALQSAGIDLFSIIRPVLFLLWLLSVVTFIITDRVEPDGHYRARKILAEIGVKKPSAYIEPGTFIDVFPGYILFIYYMKDNLMKEVRIYQLQPDRPPRVILAKRGQLLIDEPAHKVRFRLENVISDEVDPADPSRYYKFTSSVYYMSFDLPKQARRSVARKVKEYRIKDLLALRKDYTSRGIDVVPIDLVIWKRVAFSLAPLMLGLLAIAVSITSARREVSIALGLVGLVSVVYYLAMLLAETAVVKQMLPAPVGLLLPDLVFGSLGAIILSRHP